MALQQWRCRFWFVRASNEPCIEKYKTRVCWEFTHIAGSCFIFFYIRRMPRQRAKLCLRSKCNLQACRHGSSFLPIQAKSYAKVRKNGESSLEILPLQAKSYAKVRKNGEFNLEILPLQAKWYAKVRKNGEFNLEILPLQAKSCTKVIKMC